MVADVLFPYRDLPDDLSAASLYHIPQAVALDFDSTLSNTEHCMQRLYDAAGSKINAEEIRARQKEAEASGETFDPLRYVKEALNPTQYREFCGRYVQTEAPVILYDDARRFLERLQAADIPHTILSFGNNPAWQQLKMDAARFTASKYILPDPNKGVRVAAMRSTDGGFYFYAKRNGAHSYRAASITLIDDKAAAFQELPEDCRGFKIIRGEEKPSQKGNLPAHVQVIHNFDDLNIIDGELKLTKTDTPRTVTSADPVIYMPYNGTL